MQQTRLLRSIAAASDATTRAICRTCARLFERTSHARRSDLRRSALSAPQILTKKVGEREKEKERGSAPGRSPISATGGNRPTRRRAELLRARSSPKMRPHAWRALPYRVPIVVICVCMYTFDTPRHMRDRHAQNPRAAHFVSDICVFSIRASFVTNSLRRCLVIIDSGGFQTSVWTHSAEQGQSFSGREYRTRAALDRTEIYYSRISFMMRSRGAFI